MRKIQIKADFNGYKILDMIEIPEDMTGVNIDTVIKEMLLEKLSYEWEDITPDK